MVNNQPLSQTETNKQYFINFCTVRLIFFYLHEGLVHVYSCGSDFVQKKKDPCRPWLKSLSVKVCYFVIPVYCIKAKEKNTCISANILEKNKVAK